MNENLKFDYIQNLQYLRINKKRIRKYNGIIISDTFNNPIFPISIPKYDESGFYYSDYVKRFIRHYSKRDVEFLPWHFFIEFIDNKYMIYNIRPFNYMYPLNSMECINVMDLNNIETDRQFFNDIQIEDYVHVIILGDTNSDIYTSDIYYKIGKFIVNGYKEFWYNPNIKLNNGIHTLSIGKNFVPSKLITYL